MSSSQIENVRRWPEVYRNKEMNKLYKWLYGVHGIFIVRCVPGCCVGLE